MVFYKGSEVVGIIPGMIKNNKCFLIGDDRVTDLNGAILNPEYTKKIIGAVAGFILKEDLEVEFYPLVKGNALAKLLPDMLKSVKLKKRHTLPLLKLPASWDEYLDSLSPKKRHELRRKLRKAKGAETKKLEAGEINKLFKLMESSSPEKKKFLSKEMKSFFKEIALYFEKEGLLRLMGSFYRGKIIGMLFCFQSQGTIYVFNTGYNPDFSKLSPGFISFALDIKNAIDEGINYYNFLRGEERFKFELGAQRIYSWKIKSLKSA